MQVMTALIGALLLTAAMPAMAQEMAADATASGASEDVVVRGLAKSYRLNVRTLIAARRAFEDNRTAFAPAAALRFEVRERGARVAADLRLTLSDGRRAVPLPLDGDGRFVLPALPDGKWRLTANRARGGLLVRPLVMTPGTVEADRRLGDLRLQCHVMLAMIRADTSFLLTPALAMLMAVGPCSSRRIGIYYATTMAIGTAEVREGARAVPVSVQPNRHGFRAPLHDRSFGNDARVRLSG